MLSTDNFDQSDQAMVAVAGADDDFARWLIEQKLGAKQGDTLHYCLRACVGTGDIPASAEEEVASFEAWGTDCHPPLASPVSSVWPGGNCSLATPSNTL